MTTDIMIHTALRIFQHYTALPVQVGLHYLLHHSTTAQLVLYYIVQHLLYYSLHSTALQHNQYCTIVQHLLYYSLYTTALQQASTRVLAVLYAMHPPSTRLDSMC
jgi:hypothetical protein